MPSGSTKHKLAFKGATIMGTLARYHAANLPELFEKINRNSIGMDDYLNRFWDSVDSNSNYPPYNLVQVNNVESRLEIALAGFKKKEVQVYTEFGKLYVEGKKEESENVGEFVHKGLAQRSFQRLWTLADDTEVRSVSFDNGLLTVELGKIVPEHHTRKDYL
jgi:HSP20 family molecular chaperone IbpA